MLLTNLEKEKYYLEQKYLSDIELYFTSKIENNFIELFEDEFKHVTKVMRHTIGDTLNATDGLGNIYKTIISIINKDSVIASIVETKKYENRFSDIYFCFPRLKSVDRFEFEIEKLVELGITNFIIFHSERTIPKGEKLERWNKIALSAMKQSLRTYLPKFEYLKSIEQINRFEGKKIVLDQNGDTSLINYVQKIKEQSENKSIYFIFGPEGGLSKNEIGQINNCQILTLTPNRLRAETAVIATATIVALI